MTMVVIASPSFPTHRLHGVLVRMAVISFRIPLQLSRSSMLFASPHDAVACPVTVYPLNLLTITRMPRNFGGG